MKDANYQERMQEANNIIERQSFNVVLTRVDCFACRKYSRRCAACKVLIALNAQMQILHLAI
jgi:hypothetical protein